MCRYRILRGSDGAPHLLDVSFGPNLVVWGAPDIHFEPIGDSREERRPQ
jgi:hypothetical protein